MSSIPCLTIDNHLNPDIRNGLVEVAVWTDIQGCDPKVNPDFGSRSTYALANTPVRDTPFFVNINVFDLMFKNNRISIPS